MASRSCAFLSFRLGGADGVSIVASRWKAIFEELGYETIEVAGEGPVDFVLPGLAVASTESPNRPPTHAELARVLDDIELVVVENLCTIPMNVEAALAVADYLRGRPTIMHHHDPPWQRDRFAHISALPIDDPAWVHVTINEITRAQMAARGFDSTVIYNPFPADDRSGARAATRSRLGVSDGELLVTHPVRAIARKNIPVALRLAEELGGTYWLLGPTEEGYDAQVDWLLSTARVRVIREPEMHIPNIYAAADVVVFPSLWEGFGNPPIEASIYRRPVIVGDYPVGREIESLGFDWIRPEHVDRLGPLLADPDHEVLEMNREVALKHFSMPVIRDQVAALIDGAGWWS